jgi:hypothetical protein
LLSRCSAGDWSAPTPDRIIDAILPSDALNAMSQDDKLIDLNTERAKRVHDLNDKRLNEVRQAFEQAMPLGKAKKKPKNKPKKR